MYDPVVVLSIPEQGTIFGFADELVLVVATKHPDTSLSGAVQSALTSPVWVEALANSL